MFTWFGINDIHTLLYVKINNLIYTGGWGSHGKVGSRWATEQLLKRSILKLGHIIHTKIHFIVQNVPQTHIYI